MGFLISFPEFITFWHSILSESKDLCAFIQREALLCSLVSSLCLSHEIKGGEKKKQLGNEQAHKSVGYL